MKQHPGDSVVLRIHCLLDSVSSVDIVILPLGDGPLTFVLRII